MGARSYLTCTDKTILVLKCWGSQLPPTYRYDNETPNTSSIVAGLVHNAVYSFAELWLVFYRALVKPLDSSASDERAKMKNSDRDMDKMSRRRTRNVENTTMESESLFPHIPMASSSHDGVYELRPGADEEEWEEDGRDGAPAKNHGIKGDLNSIMLLMFLYILQGIPLGLAGSIPMLLQSRKVSYKEQAVFSLVYWPFSVKLLWAPLVDSIYSQWFGRRKTWLIPIQYLMGFFMLVLSTQIKSILGDSDLDTESSKDGSAPPASGQVNILLLTAIFVCLNFLAATQDIAVDGWALTMLSRRNIGWASTCNSVGQTAGYFLGNVLFLALESADFCNNYLRSEPQPEGVVTLSSFLWFWGIVFFITTTLVGVLKREHIDLDVDPDQGIVETYQILWNVIRLRSIISYAIILLTSKVAFAASDALTGLKLIEAGMPKERLALFAVPMVPIQIALPLLISKYTSGPRPMNIWIKAYPVRILIGIVYCLIVYWATKTQTTPGQFPWYFYVVTLAMYGLHQVTVYCMFVATMAFHAKISDPLIGGTYMTLLNTVANLGGNWPSTVALGIVDYITWKSCSTGETCDTKISQEHCVQGGGQCSTTVEGYYILTVVCTILGFLWLRWRSFRLEQLGELKEKAWKYHVSSTSANHDHSPSTTS
ncbi:acetyl-CoA transporter 1-like [Plakobranchus ocellatus]|uniref:Acetyl-CoA transporter 1-like n=1 Tax=Plakobranchus ocellatus TaxID=259542 RepID=A0AAV4DEF1_9GAST|nr:acetyl-CoA transporter 1-like [Plakobranchus ocellatus]